MKKWLSFLLVLMFLACAGLASAEGMDLSSLSDDELLTLHLRVQDEIVARRISATAKLPSGAYIAGKDLPAGSYIFTAQVTGEDWGNVTIYSEQGEGDQLLWKIAKAPEEGQEADAFFITLEPDDQLESGVPFSLTVYTGLTFE